MKLYGNTSRAKNGYVRQSYAGIIRQRLISIERDIAAGLRHEGIRQQLQIDGYGASMGTFRKTLSRARIWWRVQLLLAGYVSSQASTTDHETVTEQDEGAKKFIAPFDATSQSAQPRTIHPPATFKDVAPKDRLVSSSGPPPVDLDRFFKPKSVFSKPKREGPL